MEELDEALAKKLVMDLQQEIALDRKEEARGDDAMQHIVRHLQAENERLRKQCRAAWQQVADIKEFLNDYGLVWVGHEAKEGGTSKMGSGVPCKIEDLQLKIEELNRQAGDGCGQVVVGTQGEHKIRIPDPIKLVMYADGMRLHTHPFTPYHDVSARTVLKDIMDGFYPYILRESFPDGVPLKLIDKTGERCGEGRPGGKERGNLRGISDLDQPDSPLCAEKFIDKLPTAVVRGGELLDVRSEIADLLGKSSSAYRPQVIPSAADVSLTESQRIHPGPNVPPPSSGTSVANAQDVTTIQVKGSGGKFTYIIKLRFTDTVGELRESLMNHMERGGGEKTEFEIRSAFPPRVYDNDKETLEAAGLVPNATLFMKPK